MLFTEPIFLFLFLPVLLGLYFLRRPHAAYANWLLLIASVIFYAKGGGAFTVADAGLDRIQLLDGDCRRSRARKRGPRSACSGWRSR